jgi:hypothetical protein
MKDILEGVISEEALKEIKVAEEGYKDPMTLQRSRKRLQSPSMANSWETQPQNPLNISKLEDAEV